MVDQGAKGYCVVAACQRIFEYFKLPIDQHQLAPLTGTTAESGTDIRTMEAALKEIARTFHCRFDTLFKSEDGEDRENTSKAELKKFRSLLAKHLDEGIPLLWSRITGVLDEDRPPGQEEVVENRDYGHHMSVIIGYNMERNLVIYTDTWGLEHTRKVADVSVAKSITTGLFRFEPTM